VIARTVFELKPIYNEVREKIAAYEREQAGKASAKGKERAA